jgi:Fe-S-cluster containining protein
MKMNTIISISPDTIGEMFENMDDWAQELEKTYVLLPATRCRRKIHCCSMLPEMTWIEAAMAIHKMTKMPAALRLRLLKKIVRYFLVNAAEITACPFLDRQDCSIYQDRFFGCRAYGLWSMDTYEQISDQNLLSKKHLQNQWRRLGIELPHSVIDFKVPYCLDVEVVDNVRVDDNFLIHVGHEIESLSGRFAELHDVFSRIYLADFSFLVAAMMLGIKESVKLKFNIVLEIVGEGSREKLNALIRECSDPFDGLA